MRCGAHMAPRLRVARLLSALAAMMLVTAPFATSLAGQGSLCERDEECPADRICMQGFCVSGEARGPTAQLMPSGQDTSAPRAILPDDGGADAVCGHDRRCRIERIAARNQLHRQYRFIEDQEVIEAEMARIRQEQRAEIPRINRPRYIAYHNTPFGHGLLAGQTFRGFLRPELTLLTGEDTVQESFAGSQMPSFSETQNYRTIGAFITALSNDAMLSPIVSLGLVMGRGELGGTDWSSSWLADVYYHFLFGSVGVEAQFEAGMQARFTVGQGRLLYHQVRYGAGNYDEMLRPVVREHMHSNALRGFSITFGWAFQ